VAADGTKALPSRECETEFMIITMTLTGFTVIYS